MTHEAAHRFTFLTLVDRYRLEGSPPISCLTRDRRARYTRLGELLALGMWHRRINQGELALRAGIQQASLSSLMYGHRHAEADELIRLADILEIVPDEIRAALTSEQPCDDFVPAEEYRRLLAAHRELKRRHARMLRRYPVPGPHHRSPLERALAELEPV